MSEEQSLETVKAICLELAKKMQEYTAREAKLSRAKWDRHQGLDRAKTDTDKAAIRGEIQQLEVDLAELRRQHDVVSQELQQALKEGESLQEESRSS